MVVGCDGIKSAVRRTMYTDLANEAEARGEVEEAARLKALNDPIWSGTVAYRGLVPTSELEESVLKVVRIPHIVSFWFSFSLVPCHTDWYGVCGRRCWARIRWETLEPRLSRSAD